MSWARKRQIMYLSLIILVVASIAGAYWYWRLPLPACNDGVKNQDEAGVDCGGICSEIRVCTNQILPLAIWWTRIMETNPYQYDVAALVENQNREYGVKKVKYVFRLYDNTNSLLGERTGETYFNPQEKFVVYEPNLDLGKRQPATASLFFYDYGTWQKIKLDLPKMTFGAKNYTNSPLPKLETTVTNNSLKTLRNAEFMAVLSSVDGNVMAVSQTLIDVLAVGETKSLIFTWPKSFSVEPVGKDIYPKLDQVDTE